MDCDKITNDGVTNLVQNSCTKLDYLSFTRLKSEVEISRSIFYSHHL